MSETNPTIAYFSMEIALEPQLPTYSGGLGVLAGDTLRSCADLGLDVCAITLVHRQGYFRQRIASDGDQQERPDPWRPETRVEPLEPRVKVDLGGAPVEVRAWRYRIVGERGAEVPVYLLDTDLPGNPEAARRLSDRLYGGDGSYRLGQEALLGIAGVRMLRALGHDSIRRYHLNEGHAALAIPELVGEQLAAGRARGVDEAADDVRGHCIFTTHTPVPAGHDRFEQGVVASVLGRDLRTRLDELGVKGALNMTELALQGSRFVNGVAMRHGEVSQGMFPGYPIRSITNGVHAPTWASPPFRELFDRHLTHWRSNPFSLRGITAVDAAEIEEAHVAAKLLLIDMVRERTGQRLRPDVLTLGFGRRATAYKRATLLLSDPQRLARIAHSVGPLQIVFGGKAHPADEEGRGIIRAIHAAADRAARDVRIVFLPDYDWEVAGCLVAGCDVWLNTPIPPLEASGTSGMKAALNGVPSLSVLDGWWVEGCREGVTGWAIGEDGDGQRLDPVERDRLHAESLYDKLERVVAASFYYEPDRFSVIRRDTIALNGSHFNTHRMVLEYLFEAYRLDDSAGGRR